MFCIVKTSLGLLSQATSRLSAFLRSPFALPIVLHRRTHCRGTSLNSKKYHAGGKKPEPPPLFFEVLSSVSSIQSDRLRKCLGASLGRVSRKYSGCEEHASPDYKTVPRIAWSSGHVRVWDTFLGLPSPLGDTARKLLAAVRGNKRQGRTDPFFEMQRFKAIEITSCACLMNFQARAYMMHFHVYSGAPKLSDPMQMFGHLL